jgi:hypothetical protein
MFESYSPDQRIYEEEFKLNLKHSFPNPKEVINVAYQIENMVLATIIIPKDLFPFKLKFPKRAKTSSRRIRR